MAVKKITKKTTKKVAEVLPIVDINDVVKILENSTISKAQHMEILGLCLKEIGYFPIQDSISKHMDGSLLYNGRNMTMEAVVQFRSHLHSLKDNIAFKLISDQVIFDAIKEGVHKSDTVEKIMFSKSAIYIITKLREYIESFDN